MIRLAAIAALFWVVAGITPAAAHASLIASEPADGALLASPPAMIVLTFNEQVAPTVLRLVAPGGTATELRDFHAHDSAIMIMPPADWGRGTYALTWRVVSSDGHPVGGALVFSIGEVTAAPPAAVAGTDPIVAGGIWLARLCLYVGLFIGVGGAFFTAVVGPPGGGARGSRNLIAGASGLGLAAVPVALGLQGLDLLSLPIGDFAAGKVWSAARATTLYPTLLTAGAALVAAILAGEVRQPYCAVVAGLAVVLAGVALMLSGHAANAEPQALTRPAVLLHTLAVAFWVGALLPLGALMFAGGAAATPALMRFSRIIPSAVAILVVTGALLAIVQLDHVSALWETAYGRILLVKLGLVGMLLALAALNRFRLTRRVLSGEASARRAMARSIVAEVVIAILILGAVAGWRFTPPPRALVASEPAVARLVSERAAATVTLTPGRAGAVTASIVIVDPAGRPFAAREAVLVLSNDGAGIGTLRRPLVQSTDGAWRADALVLPAGGQWHVDLDVLVSDFDELGLEGDIALAP